MPANLSDPSTSSQSALSRVLRIAMIVVAVALFLLTRWYILFELEPKASDIVGPYFPYAARAFDLHQVPYQSDFKVEYPPVAWWAIYMPRLVETRRIVNPRDAQEVAPIFKVYRNAFRGEMFLCDLGAFVLLLLTVHKRRPRWVGWAALAYVVATAILGNLLYDRLDVGLTLLLLLWSYFWIKSLDESDHAIAWTAAAYAMLGLSISYKLIPVITLPFLLLAEWRAPRWQHRLTTALIAVGATAGLPFVIQYAISGPGVFQLFEYHSERGIEVESLYSTLMMFASLFGSPVYTSHSHGAYELSGVLAKDMKSLSSVLLLGFLLTLGAWALWQGSRYHRLQAYCTTLFVICSSVILANVLSPQYFLWAIPMAMLLAVEVLPTRWWWRWTLLVLLITVAGTTTWIFPYNFYRSISNANGLLPAPWEDRGVLFPLPCLILGLRNLSYLGVVVWLGVLLFRRGDDAAIQSSPTRRVAAEAPPRRIAMPTSEKRQRGKK